ncbi:hypothetical protein PP359_00260 [Sphingomonas sp. BLCC-B65]|nr:hypothetical protein [Sphingomonas sp. BLCC-B65]
MPAPFAYPARDILAVVSQSGPTVSFLDAFTLESTGQLALPAEPHELCFDESTRMLWCTSTYFGGYYHANAGRRTQLTAIDPDSQTVVEVVDLDGHLGPHGLALDADHQRLYVSVEGDDARTGGVVVVDTRSRKVLKRINTGAFGPHWFITDPDGRYGYATNKEAPFVSVVDLATDALIDRIAVPGSEGLAVSADGRELYVAAPYGSFAPSTAAERPERGVRVIDTASREVVCVLPTENIVFPVHLTSKGSLLAGELRMSPDASSKLGAHAAARISVFDPQTRSLRGEVEIEGRFPLTMSSSPDGSRAYVSCVTSSTVEMIDVEALQRTAIAEIPKLGEPGAHGLAYIPSANAPDTDRQPK